MNIIISGNSPGEIWGWVRPFVFALRKRCPDSTISLFLFPCPYATGKEEEVAREILGIENVFSPRESLKYIFFGKKPHSFSAKNSVLVHLGGDIMFASLLAKRLKAPAYVYQWGEKLWDSSFKGYFVPGEKQKKILMQRKIPEKKIMVVGDLMVDSIKLELSNSGSPETYPGTLSGKKFLVTLFAGSRKAEIKHMLPFYLRVAEVVRERLPQVEFSASFSPFVEDADVALSIDSGQKRLLESSGGILVKNDEKKFIRTERGVQIFVSRGEQYRFMQESDCILTIPGTKCGEAGFLGTPMLVTLPTNKLEEVPYPGIPNLVEKIPFIGKRLKRIILANILPRFGFLSQPNILAQEQIVPEMVANLTPQTVADSLISLLLDETRREKMREKLKQIYGTLEPAAEKMIEVLAGKSHE